VWPRLLYLLFIPPLLEVPGLVGRTMALSEAQMRLATHLHQELGIFQLE
jgi:hypothetical protein